MLSGSCIVHLLYLPLEFIRICGQNAKPQRRSDYTESAHSVWAGRNFYGDLTKRKKREKKKPVSSNLAKFISTLFLLFRSLISLRRNWHWKIKEPHEVNESLHDLELDLMRCNLNIYWLRMDLVWFPVVFFQFLLQCLFLSVSRVILSYFKNKFAFNFHSFFTWWSCEYFVRER